MDEVFKVKAKFVLLFTLSFQYAFYGEAQNLVPNSSFEQIRKKPCEFIGRPERLSDYFDSWQTPTSGTADGWYYGLGISPDCYVNTAIYGVTPHTGSACIGLHASSMISENISKKPYSSDYREYAQVKLSKPLTIGRTYHAEMYVLPLNVSGVFNNNIGMCFTTNLIQQYTGNDFGNSYTHRLPYQPEINEKKVLNVPNKWVRIAGCFKATQACSYITIGNFFSDENTSFVVNRNYTFGANIPRMSCYYLIDDVLVRELTDQETPIAFGRNIDTTLCNNAVITVSPSLSDGTRIAWENGSNVPARTIKQPGTYLITASKGECEHVDTLRVRREVNPVLPVDTVLCRGESLPVSVSHPLKKYAWSTGSADSTITITESGVYRLRIPSAACQLADTLSVQFLDCPGMIPNVITPNGDGKNDTFRIDNTDLTAWQLDVYNRWGKVVYSSLPYQNEWNGGNLPGGVYYYLLQSAALKRELKGWVQLLR